MLIVVVAGALGWLAPVGSAAAAPAATDLVAVDRFVTAELEAASIPGAALAVTHGDRVLHVRGYGHDSRGDPVTAATPFRIASLSKSFTSLAVLQLVDAGLLELHDTVVSHVPEFRPADPRAKAITVRQLLDQTSGLADRVVGDLSRRQPATLREATTMLRSARLVAAPGAEFNYHNPNYHVAARLVEVVSGEDFATYLQRHVFRPAGMLDSTSTDRSDDPVPGLANGHVRAYGHAFAMPAPSWFVAGAGGVVSTARDMARWLIVNADDGGTAGDRRLISPEGLRQLHSPSAPTGYALGWDTDEVAGERVRVHHDGSLLTFTADQAVMPATGDGVALLFNSGSASRSEQTAIFHGVLDILEGSDPGRPDAVITPARIDAALAVATGVVLALGVRGVVRARRWGRRQGRRRVRTAARLAPYLLVVGVGVGFPGVAEHVMHGRDVSWVAAAYGWPALVVLVWAAMAAAFATVVARLLGVALRSRSFDRREPSGAWTTVNPDSSRTTATRTGSAS